MTLINYNFLREFKFTDRPTNQHNELQISFAQKILPKGIKFSAQILQYISSKQNKYYNNKKNSVAGSVIQSTFEH